MPLVSCPKCTTNLRVPDGASGNIKCPKCARIFPVAATPAPAFEVVEAEPAKPAARKAAPEPDFEIIDEPKPKKRAVVDDDDVDDRPRSKRRRDEEDDDDRPRKKKKRRDYDDEEDYRPAAKGSSFGAAKVGMLMVSISLWLYVGTFALLALFLLIAWLGAAVPSGLMIVTGLLGLTNWILGLIGLGFCIAGPSQSRGLAIAATVLAVIHIVMAFVIANNEKTQNPGSMSIGMATASSRADRLKSLADKAKNEKDPAKLREIEKEARELFEDVGELRSSSKSEMRWPDLATLLPFSDILIANLAYESRNFNDYVLGLLGGLIEIARAILIILLIGSIGRAARDRAVAEKSMMAMIAFAIGIVVSMVIWVIVAAILDGQKGSSGPNAGKGAFHWFVVGALLVYLIHLGTLVFPALLGLEAKDAAARKAR